VAKIKAVVIRAVLGLLVIGLVIAAFCLPIIVALAIGRPAEIGLAYCYGVAAVLVVVALGYAVGDLVLEEYRRRRCR